jgi:Ferritin-like
MKTIAEFVEQGINNVAELQDALQTAMQLEFSTIPPYLCAQWSIEDVSLDVYGLIQNIVIQEMFHFAAVGNILSAIGVTPNIDTPTFLPTYPTTSLPGGILLMDRSTDPPTPVTLDLLPLSLTQLLVFMAIEYPQVTAAINRDGSPTIGDFYDTITTALNTLSSQNQITFNSNANFIRFGPVGPITSLTDAISAISVIKQEGEGAAGSPDQSANTPAHYYTFAEIYEGANLVQDPTTGIWSYTGTAITFPSQTQIYQFSKSANDPSDQNAFSAQLSGILKNLQAIWTSGGQLNPYSTMNQLLTDGLTLITQTPGIQPQFVLPSC